MRSKSTAILACLLAVFLASPAYASEPEPVHGIVYGPYEEEQLTVLPQPGAGATTVVFVHLGGWRKQPRKFSRPFPVKVLQKWGFAVVDPNYPQGNEEGAHVFPLEPNAIVEATHWALEHITEYGGDPDNIVMVGESAGGQLAAMASDKLNATHPGTILALMLESAPTDLWRLVQEAASLRRKLRKSLLRALECEGGASECSRPFAETWSPIENIDPATCIPTLLASYEKDLVPVTQAKSMTSALLSAGCSAQVEVFAGKGHVPPIRKTSAHSFIGRY
jgi:acetyl esterase/lipase